MRSILTLLLCIPLTAFAASSESDIPKQTDQEIIESCETEGVSVGFKGADLKVFVEECVVDFLDTTVEITPTHNPDSADQK